MLAVPAGVMLHVPGPGGVVSVTMAVPPSSQAAKVPPIGFGIGSTVTVLVTAQLVGKVKITVTVPADTPVNEPLIGLIVAIDVGAVLQVPGEVTSDMVIDAFTHTSAGPVIGSGSGFTVNSMVSIQPVPSV